MQHFCYLSAISSVSFYCEVVAIKVAFYISCYGLCLIKISQTWWSSVGSIIKLDQTEKFENCAPEIYKI